MWSDNETTEDYLGFKVHADLIYEMVSKPSLLPITIGVFADWGGGKSSVLRMLQDKIKGDESAGRYCLYVNGWLFEGYDDAKAALIGSVLRQLAEHPILGKRIKDKVMPFLKSVDYMRFVRMAMKGGVGVTALSSFGIDPATAMTVLGLLLPASEEQSGDAVDLGSKGKAQEETVVNIRDFRDKFGKLLRESKIESLVVLVDDLDRCSPRHIIDNLEAIKLFLNVEHTAFVIGADPRLVSHAIRIHYRSLAGGADMKVDNEDQIVNDYLEKLIHVPFTLPRLSIPEVETYMSMLFCQYNLDSERFEKCIDALNKYVDKDRYSAFSVQQVKDCLGDLYKPDEDRELTESLAFCQTAAPLIGDGLKGNPRQIKRFLNTYMIRRKLGEVAKLGDIRTDVLIKLMVLEYGCDPEFRKLYDFIRSQNGLAKELSDLEDVCRVSEGEVPKPDKLDSLTWGSNAIFLHRWAQMDPPLSGIDLRDYVWLSRDRMESTLTGIQLVAPYLKELMNNLLSDQGVEREQAVKAVSSLDQNDISIVLGELRRLLVFNADDKRYYIAFDLLIRGGVPAADSALAEALMSVDTRKADPSSGYLLAKLIIDIYGLDHILKENIKKLSGDNTKIGKTIKLALNNKKGKRR